MPPSLRYQFVEVVREARPDPNAQSLTSPHPGEHLGNFDDREWGFFVIGVGHRTGQAIELGHHQHVASATRCECRPESWSVSVLPRESVVHVDPLGVHPHGHQRISLCGEVLLVGAATGVRHENLAHPPTVSYEPYPHREEHRAGLTGTRRPGLTPPPAARCVVPFRILSNRRLRTRDEGALSGPFVVLVLLATAYCLLLQTTNH